MKPEVLSKIESRWPHLASMCDNYRATGDVRIRNGIVHAVLTSDVGYLTPSEVLYLAALRAGGATSDRKAKSSRDNGKLGGRPKKPKRVARRSNDPSSPATPAAGAAQTEERNERE